MSTVIEFLREALSSHNLPATVLLGLVVLYWLLVIVGAVDMDLEVDADAGDAGDMGSHHVSTGGTVGAGVGGGGRVGRHKWLDFSGVPLNISGSILAIFFWLGSLWGNYYLNGTSGNRSVGMAILLLFPNGIVSLLLTRVAIIPLQKLFRKMQEFSTEVEVVVGREGRVVSAKVDERYGQVEVPTKSVPLLINARVSPGEEVLEKGTQVLIHAAIEDGHYYLVKAKENPAEASLTHPPNP